MAVLYDGDVYDPRLLDVGKVGSAATPRLRLFSTPTTTGRGGRIKGPIGSVSILVCRDERLYLYFRRWHFTSPVWGTVMFRKSEYLAVGGLDIHFSFFADADLYLKLAETNCVAYLPEPLIGLASRETVPKLFRPPPDD